MKFHILVASCLFAGHITAAHEDSKVQENNLPSTTAEAVATVGVIGTAYWMTKNGKDLFKKYVLPEQITAFQGSSFPKVLAREAASAVLYTTAVVSIKTMLSNQFGGKVLADGKITAQLNKSGEVVSNPSWIEKAWSLGTAVAFAKLAYDIGKGSIASDAFRSLKSRFVSAK